MTDAIDRCPVCGQAHEGPEGPIFSRLWIYTNYDCNLACSYCLVSSSPRAERRGLSAATFAQVIDEAAELGCREVFLTGGEPALLPRIVEMIAYALPRMRVTMLTNGMLWKGARLSRLESLREHPDSGRLTLQISLDSGSPEIHDRNRGAGTWAKTVAGIHLLRDRGFSVRTGTTETTHSAEQMEELRAFLTGLGIPPQDQIVRELVARGESRNGAVLTGADLVPEMTVDVNGVYWHPIMGEDLRITESIFPLRAAAAQLGRLWHTISGQSGALVFR
ncbi:MAG TPA: radical SAM protein [Chloroflexota bacterium]|nr:radical SAM protein [Chloroflexota bacterium]